MWWRRRRARAGLQSQSLLRDRFFSVDQLHLGSVNANDPPRDPGPTSPPRSSADQQHPAERASPVPARHRRRDVVGRRPLSRKLHRQAPALRRRLGRGARAAAIDDAATGLPLPKPWLLTTAKNSPFIKSVHVETPLDLAAVLGFYRVELSKRGWTENDGAVVEPDRAVIAFTTTDGPALLRLIHQDDRTIADLSLRKPAAANAGIQPRPGQARLMLGNDARMKRPSSPSTSRPSGWRLAPGPIGGRRRRRTQIAGQPEDRSAAGQVQGHPQGGERRGAEPGVRGRCRRDLGPAGRSGWRPAARAPLLKRGDPSPSRLAAPPR